MSMHLCGPALTTTSYKKRKQKVTKAQQEEFERGWRERNVRLKQMGLSKETFEQYMEWVHGKGKKAKEEKKNRTKSPATITKSIDTSYSSKTNISENQGSSFGNSSTTTTHGKVWVKGACTTKQTPTYTGTKIIGIGTMHKSNAVPIFSDEEAIDISRMRR